MNWTLHYQRDATVFWPYGQVRLRDAPVAIRPNYYASKARKVIWIVSRCFTLYAHREHYVAEVSPTMQIIKVKLFGKRCLYYSFKQKFLEPLTCNILIQA